VIKRLLLVVCLAMCPIAATAQGIPVELFVSPNDDGAGGAAIRVAPDSGQRSVAVWASFQGVAGGSGAISVQDVLFHASGEIGIVGFTCVLTDCIVGNRSDPRTALSFPSRELIFTAGDDTSASPTLTGLTKVGDLVVDIGSEPGELALAGGTALGGDSASGQLEIAALSNEGKLVVLVPEPAQALQTIFAIATLVWVRRRLSSAPI
jgi:hypothetical protein